jgi:hypothetical protein
MKAVHSLFVTLALAAVAMLPGDPAQGQSPAQGCKPEQLGAQKAVDFGMAYAAADKRAKAWQADVVVVRLGNTMLGPIDAEARSANWYMVWFSGAAKKTIAVSIANGMLTCSTDEDAGRAVPAMKGDLYRDVKQMLATGAEKGGADLIAKGAQPMVQFSVGPNSSGRKGIWFINYQVKQGPSLQVTFDGVTGKFEQAIPS